MEYKFEFIETTVNYLRCINYKENVIFHETDYKFTFELNTKKIFKVTVENILFQEDSIEPIVINITYVIKMKNNKEIPSNIEFALDVVKQILHDTKNELIYQIKKKFNANVAINLEIDTDEFIKNTILKDYENEFKKLIVRF